MGFSRAPLAPGGARRSRGGPAREILRTTRRFNRARLEARDDARARADVPVVSEGGEGRRPGPAGPHAHVAVQCHAGEATAMAMALAMAMLTLSAVQRPLTDADYHRGPWNAHPDCPAAVTLDAEGTQRKPGSEYAWFNATRSVEACAKVCCRDWSCWGFAFYPKSKTGNNSAMWPKITLQKHPTRISIDCANASQARGYDCRGDNLSPLGNSCDDPTQPCCALLSDFEDTLVPTTVPGVRSGIRGRLPARDPPLGTARSSVIKNILFGDKLYIGGESVYPRAHATGTWDLGDEFPTAWADDGFQYAGAGDNSASGYSGSDSPLTMWRINGSNPRTATFSLVGNHTPVSVPNLCPITKSGVPNLKSQSVLAIGRTLYWAVACFDYIDPDIGSVLSRPGLDPARGFDSDLMHWRGMDETFNRQRYGVNDTAFIMASTDSGASWALGEVRLTSTFSLATHFWIKT